MNFILFRAQKTKATPNVDLFKKKQTKKNAYVSKYME